MALELLRRTQIRRHVQSRVIAHHGELLDCDLNEWLKSGGMANAHADGLPIARDAFQDAVRTFISHINPYAILHFMHSREECDRLRPNDALCTAFSAVTIKTVTRRLSSTANVEREHEFWDAWLREKIRDTSAPPRREVRFNPAIRGSSPTR